MTTLQIVLVSIAGGLVVLAVALIPVWMLLFQLHFGRKTMRRITGERKGQLIEGGRPEVVMVVGDGIGPLVMYEWQDGFWESTILLENIDNGHTLDIVDFNGDGHLDIFN